MSKILVNPLTRQAIVVNDCGSGAGGFKPGNTCGKGGGGGLTKTQQRVVGVLKEKSALEKKIAADESKGLKPSPVQSQRRQSLTKEISKLQSKLNDVEWFQAQSAAEAD